MFSWLKKRGEKSQGTFKSDNESVISSDYKYGFKSTTNSKSSSSRSLTAFNDHIYEDISDHIEARPATVTSLDTDSRHSMVLPYAVTALDDIIDCELSEDPLSDVYFNNPVDNQLSSDSGIEIKNGSSCDDIVSTTSSNYQPINLQPVERQPPIQSRRLCHMDSFKRRTSSSLAIVKRSKNKCSRWLSTQFINISKRSSRSFKDSQPSISTSSDEGTVPCQKQVQSLKIFRRSESTRQHTKRRLDLKKIADNWLDSDDDSSFSSEESVYPEMELLDYSREPGMLQSRDYLDIYCNSELGLLKEDELPVFNPVIGFGINRWYRPTVSA